MFFYTPTLSVFSLNHPTTLEISVTNNPKHTLNTPQYTLNTPQHTLNTPTFL